MDVESEGDRSVRLVMGSKTGMVELARLATLPRMKPTSLSSNWTRNVNSEFDVTNLA